MIKITKTLVLVSLLEEENYFITELLNLGYLDPLECQIFAISIRHFRFFIDSFHFFYLSLKDLLDAIVVLIEIKKSCNCAAHL